MSDPQTFADLWQQFMDGWDEFNEQWSDAWDHCVKIINDGLNFIADNIPFTTSAAEKARDKWNDEIAPALREGYGEVWDKVNELLSDLAGSPLALQGYAETFAKAKGDLFTQRGFEEAAAAMAGSWSGNAYDAYVPVATKQNAALKQLGDALTEGSKLTSAASAKILSVWADLIHQFATFYGDIISTLSGALTVEDILTFGAKALLALIAKIWQRVADVVKILADFMIAQATTDSVAWVSIAAGSGGLAGNEWPPISETSSDAVNQPGGWG